VDIDFTGFAGDCIITGRFVLGARRLTDQLNLAPTITLEEVVLDGFDGQRVTTPTFTIDRSELCAVVGSAADGRCESRPKGAASTRRSGPTSSSADITAHMAPRACAISSSAIPWSP
jgi:hypothetical protein